MPLHLFVPLRVICRPSRLACLALAALALVAGASPARADVIACRTAIMKGAQRLAQASFMALQRCEERVVKSAVPLAIDCANDPSTLAAIAKAESALRAALPKKCGGKNKICTLGDAGLDADDALAAIGWDLGTCPDLEHGGCTMPLADCNDVAACLVCASAASLERARAVYYERLVLPSATRDRRLNKCQRAIGKATVKLFATKSKALLKCWSAVAKAKQGFVAPCPAGDVSGKTAAAIAKLETQARASICKACGGADKLCNGVDDESATAIGFPPRCPAVTVPGRAPCSAAVTILADLADCVGCVTEFKVDCLDALATPWGTSYPPECNPACGDGVRSGAEACDREDDAACPGACQLDCTCAQPTATRTATVATPTILATPSAARTATPTRTGTPSATSSATRTPTPTKTPTVTKTTTPTATKTSTPTRTATPVVTKTTTPTAPGATPTATATPSPTCGDGIVDPGEQCDVVGCPPGKECQDDCTCVQPSLCGNGVVDPPEECDGSGCPIGQTCLDSCTCFTPPRCGNGTIDPGEQCDLGTGCADGEECLADCTCSTTPTCGNGSIDPGEDCDGGRCPNGHVCPEDCHCP